MKLNDETSFLNFICVVNEWKGYFCSIAQIENWLKDLIADSNGKLAHMKYVNDDLNPNSKHLWARMHDEINGVLIFMTELHEEYFVDSDIWMIDGTFRCAPKEYEQILNIMGANLLKNTYLTVGHILLKGKKEVDYINGLTSFLSQIVSSLHNLRVKMIISDFEKGLLNAIEETINKYKLNEELSREVRIQGCLFHFSQCIVRTFSKYYQKNNFRNEKNIIYFIIFSVFKLASPH